MVALAAFLSINLKNFFHLSCCLDFGAKGRVVGGFKGGLLPITAPPTTTFVQVCLYLSLSETHMLKSGRFICREDMFLLWYTRHKSDLLATLRHLSDVMEEE